MRYYGTFRRIIKTISYLLVFLSLIFLVSVLLFSFSGEGTRRELLVSVVETVTGGELTLGEPFRLEVGRELRLEAGGVKIVEARKVPFVRFEADRVELRFPLLPLLLQRRLELEYRQEGGVVELSPGKGAEAPGPVLVSLVPVKVTLQDVRVLLPAEKGGPRTLSLSRLSLRRADERLELDLEGRYGEQGLRVETTLAALPDPEGRRAMRIEARIGGLEVVGEGWQGPGKPSLRLHLSARAPGLRILKGPPFDSLPELGPVEVESDLVLDGAYRAENLRVSLDGGKRFRLRAKGRIADLATGDGLALALEAGSGDTRGFLAALGVDWRVPFDRAELAGTLAGDYEALRLEGMKLDLQGKEVRVQAEGKAEGIGRVETLVLHLGGVAVVQERKMEFSLRLDRERKGRRPLGLKVAGDGVQLRSEGFLVVAAKEPAVEMEVEGEAADLVRLEPWLGMEFNPVKPVKLRGRFVARPSHLDLEIGELLVGDSDLQGRLAFGVRPGAPLHVEGALSSRNWNLSEQLLRRKRVQPRLVQGEEADADALAKGGEQERLFSREPFGLGWISAWEGRVALRFGELRHRHYRMEELSAEMVATGTEVRLDAIRGRMGGAPVEGAFRLDGAASPPEMALRLQFAGADLAAGFPGFGLPADSGTVGLALDLRAAGRSQAEVAASMEGEIRLQLHDTPFGFGLPRALEKSLLEHLNPLAKEEPEARRLECGALYAKLEKGVARTPRGVAIVFPQVAWVGDGVVDLGKETLYVTLKPRPRKRFSLSLKGLADLVAVSGTLSSPYIVINPRGALLTSLSYTAAVYSGGASLLVESILDELRRKKDPCAHVLRPSTPDSRSSRKKTQPSESILDQLEMH